MKGDLRGNASVLSALGEAVHQHGKVLALCVKTLEAILTVLAEKDPAFRRAFETERTGAKLISSKTSKTLTNIEAKLDGILTTLRQDYGARKRT
jgi:hypothetical protein